MTQEKDQETKYAEYEFPTKQKQDLEIDILYDQLNKFIRKHNVKNPLVTYTDSQQRIIILKKDCELDIAYDNIDYNKPLIKVKVSSRGQMKTLEKEINDLENKKRDNSQQLSRCQETIRNNSSTQCDIVLFYAQPVKKDNKDVTPCGDPVTYENEIHTINKIIQKRNKLKSLVATIENLGLFLQQGIKYFHISCHGNKNDNNKFYLEFQSSSELGVIKPFQQQDIVKKFKDQILNSQHKPTLVLINACYSGSIAQSLHKQGAIQYTIGINKLYPILNEAAQKFTSKFYEVLLISDIPSAFKQAVKYVRSQFQKKKVVFCCCHAHSQRKIHQDNCNYKIGVCKFHSILNQFSCECPNKYFCLHLNQCKLLSDIPEQNKFKRKNNQKQQLICCCNKIHDQSQKFQLFYDEKNVNIKKTSLTSYQAEKSHELQEQYIQFDQRATFRFYKNNDIFFKNVNILIQTTNDIFFIIGQEHSGTTSYSRKLLYYIRQRKSISELIQVNCIDYKSIADLFLNFTVTRKMQMTNKFFNMNKILSDLLKNKKDSFLVFDHCDQLFQSSEKQITSFINKVRRQLQFTKIIIILKKKPAQQILRNKKVIQIDNIFFIKKIVCSKLKIQKINENQVQTRLKHLGKFDINKIKNIQQGKIVQKQFFEELEKEKQARDKKMKELDNFQNQLKNKQYYSDIIVLSVFKKITIDEQFRILETNLKYSISFLKNQEFLKQIIDQTQNSNVFKFKQQWIKYLFSKQQILSGYLVQICLNINYYVSYYIAKAIQSNSNYSLTEFYISPFQNISNNIITDQTRYLTSQDQNNIVQNIKYFLSLTLKSENKQINEQSSENLMNSLINIPFLMELFHHEQVSVFIHKCLNKMNLIDKDNRKNKNNINYYHGILRLCYQLNRNLLSSQTNLQYSIEVINDIIVPQEISEIPDQSVKIERSLLILQQNYYLLQSSSNDSIIDGKLISPILSQFNKLVDIIDKIKSKKQCYWKIYTYIGALILKVIEKYDLNKVVQKFNTIPRFKIDILIKTIEQFIPSSETQYMKQKVYTVYYNLKLAKLEYQNTIETQTYKKMQEEVRQLITKYPSLKVVQDKINETISRKSENMITILSSIPLGLKRGNQFQHKKLNIFRNVQKITQNLHKKLNQIDIKNKLTYIKSMVLNKKNLIQILDEGCLLQVLCVDVIQQNKQDFVLFENRNRVGELEQINQFVEKYNFEKVSILIISGGRVKRLQDILLQKYKGLLLIFIQKNQDMNDLKLPFAQYDQAVILNECNKYFITEFCKQLIKRSPFIRSVQIFCLICDIAKHKTIVNLIQNCINLRNESDVDKYISIRRAELSSNEKMQKNIDQNEQYLSFEPGDTNIIYNVQNQNIKNINFEELQKNINIMLNKKIFQTLQLLQQNNNLNVINLCGSQYYLRAICQEVVKTFIRQGEHSYKVFLKNSKLSTQEKNKKFLIVQFNFYDKYEDQTYEFLNIVKRLCKRQNTKLKILILSNQQLPKRCKDIDLTDLYIEKKDIGQLNKDDLRLWAYAWMKKRYRYVENIKQFQFEDYLSQKERVNNVEQIIHDIKKSFDKDKHYKQSYCQKTPQMKKKSVSEVNNILTSPHSHRERNQRYKHHSSQCQQKYQSQIKEQSDS